MLLRAILWLPLNILAAVLACMVLVAGTVTVLTRAAGRAARGLMEAAFAPPRVAYAIRDSALFLRTSGAGSLTATETATGIAINGTPHAGLALVVDIPKQSVGDTMQVTLQHSTDDSTYTTLLTLATLTSTATAITTPVKFARRFHTRLKYVRTVTTVAGTSPDFGAAVILIGDNDEWNTLTRGQNAGSEQPV